MSTNRPLDPDPDDEPTTGPPRWVTVVGVVLAIALLSLLIVLHLTGTLGAGAHS